MFKSAFKLLFIWRNNWMNYFTYNLPIFFLFHQSDSLSQPCQNRIWGILCYDVLTLICLNIMGFQITHIN